MKRRQAGHGDVDEEVVVASQHVDRADLGEGEREGPSISGLLCLESAGLTVEMSLERVNYPQEIETRRAYLLVRNQQS